MVVVDVATVVVVGGDEGTFRRILHGAASLPR